MPHELIPHATASCVVCLIPSPGAVWGLVTKALGLRTLQTLRELTRVC